MAQGTVTALGVLVGGAGSMWLLFWLVGKKREAMRQPTPDWDKKADQNF